MKNLLLSALNRGDLRRLNYKETVYGRGFAPDPARRAHDDALSDPESDGREYFLPILLSSRLETLGRRVLLLNWFPHFLDRSYAPAGKFAGCCS